MTTRDKDVESLTREVKKEPIDDNCDDNGANVFGGVKEDFEEENLMVAPEIYEEVSLCWYETNT